MKDFDVYKAKELESYLLSLYEKGEDVFFDKLDEFNFNFHQYESKINDGDIRILITLDIDKDVIAFFKVSKCSADLSLNILNKGFFYSNHISDYLLLDFDLRLLNGFILYMEERVWVKWV